MSDEDALLIQGPQQNSRLIVLAHGAGAAMDTPFMNAFADGLADHGACVVRFEFPYMAERRRSGKKRGPDPAPVLLATWQRIVSRVREQFQPQQLIIGGKSLGGRMASMLADSLQATGLVCLGYPFHPAGKAQQLRIEHLQTLSTPTLIVQGERDTLGNRDEVAEYALSQAIQLHWLPDGDHSFAPRKSSGRTTEQNWRDGLAAVVAFVDALK